MRLPLPDALVPPSYPPIQWLGETLTLHALRYLSGGGVALHLVDATGCPFVTASVNPPADVVLAADEVAVKDYAENAGVLDALVTAGVVAAPHRWLAFNHVRVPVCRLRIKPPAP